MTTTTMVMMTMTTTTTTTTTTAVMTGCIYVKVHVKLYYTENLRGETSSILYFPKA